MHVLLIGTGYMGREYAKVLDALHVPYTVVGRGEDSAKAFYEDTNKKPITGGLENGFAQVESQVTHAIVATTLESLEENTSFLLENNVKQILVEKPAALSLTGMQQIVDLSKEKQAAVYIAYNRRFYSPVMEAEKRINEEGGLTSFTFEFTEWSHLVGGLNKTEFQLNNWFIGNSTHVVDTAFYFGGKPKEIHTHVAKPLTWHPKGSIYAGSGVTEKGVLFSYHANWEAPGSWKLELFTNESRYIFRPFEKLHVQKIGSMVIEEVPIDNQLDIQFKPGLYEQTKAFLMDTNLKNRLLNVYDGIEFMKIYEEMNEGAQ
ncbi:myo-inositol 2-dehydrogenase [Bacillaceae bacterium SAOS 7]|nr:myo-inositol 2-dehydrogenase [Bacillaceae bacterium SAOS 7]